MASFETTYNNYVQPGEAYYVDDPADPGGETYGGIARKIFPAWEGWAWLDAWKAQNGTPRWNQQFKELDPLVRTFFQNLWNKNNFHALQSQPIANIYFDWFVNTIRVYAETGKSVPVKEVQKLVGVTADGLQGAQTVAAINRQNETDLFNRIKQARENFYRKLVAQTPSLAKFLPGWLRRLDKFSLATGAASVVGILLFFF